MKRLLLLTILVALLAALFGCDDFSHDPIVNTPPPNYVILLGSYDMGGDSTDTGSDLEALPDDRYAVVGASSSWGNGESVAYLAVVDSRRATLWSQFYGGWGRDYGESIMRTALGQYLVVGGTSSFDLTTNEKVDPLVNPAFNFAEPNMYLLLTDEAGTVVWERVAGTTESPEWATSAVESGGGFLVAGLVVHSEVEEDLVVLRVDGAGEVAWQKPYASTAFDRHTRILATMDNHFVLAGDGQFGPARGRDPHLIKIDADGTTVWEKTYGWPTSHESLNSVIAVADGLVGCGSSQQFIGTDSAADLLYVLKTDYSGNVVWEHSYTRTGINEGRALVQKTDGSFIVCGQNYGLGGIDVCKIGTVGQLVWSDATGVTGESKAMMKSDRGFVVAGYGRQSGSAVLTDVLLLEFKEDLTNIQ